MPNFTNDEVNDKFKGTVSSLDDLLPCPRCKSLRSRNAPSIDCAYYERRYQCVDCGQFYRFDTRPIEESPEEFIAKENLKIAQKFNPNGTQPGTGV